MREIQLTQGQVALVDDEDYEYINQWKWYARWCKDIRSFYAVRRGENHKTIYMHRIVMNTPSDLVCDHIYHNTLDNQKKNLRNVTQQQNLSNRKMFVINKLGKGCISQDRNSFRVRISSKNKRVFSKSYKTLDEAVAARDKVLDELHLLAAAESGLFVLISQGIRT